MQVHNVQQGTPEWHALRSSYFTASEAPAMMGASKYQNNTVAFIKPAKRGLFYARAKYVYLQVLTE